MPGSTVEDTSVVDQETTLSNSITDLVTELPAMGNETSTEPPSSRYPKRATKPVDHYTSDN